MTGIVIHLLRRFTPAPVKKIWHKVRDWFQKKPPQEPQVQGQKKISLNQKKKHVMLNVCFIADNRGRLNFGCRGTSIALRRLLDKSVNVRNTIFGHDGQMHTIFFQVKSLGELQKNVQIAFENPNDSLAAYLKVYKEVPRLKEWYDKINGCDAIVINGEGTFIFTTPARNDSMVYLLFIKLAHHLGKKIYLVNTIFSYAPEGVETNAAMLGYALETFKLCDVISLRDPLSLDILRNLAPELPLRYIPDALFSMYDEVLKSNLPSNANQIIPFPEWPWLWDKGVDFAKPYIILSGSSIAPKYREACTKSFVTLVDALKSLGQKLYLMPTCGGDVFLFDVGKETNVPVLDLKIPIMMGMTILANAAVFISGRFHPSIMATLGGTPCVFMKSNSHKTLSLQSIIYKKHSKMKKIMPESKEYSVFPDDSEICEIKEKVKMLMELHDDFRNEIKLTASELAKESADGIHQLFTERKQPNTWGKSEKFTREMENRIEKMLTLIDINKISSIMDLGCGDQALKRHIPSDMSYFPVNQYNQAPGTIIKDFNKGEFLHKNVDVCFASGIFEYIYDVEAFLENIASNCDYLLASYFRFRKENEPRVVFNQNKPDTTPRVNHYSEEEFLGLMTKHRFTLIKSQYYIDGKNSIFLFKNNNRDSK